MSEPAWYMPGDPRPHDSWGTLSPAERALRDIEALRAEAEASARLDSEAPAPSLQNHTDATGSPVE